MFNIKKLVFSIILGPVILFLSVRCFLCNLKVKQCSKKLLSNLNLETLQKLTLNELTQIIIFFLKAQKIKILDIIYENDVNIIVAYKKHKRILINIANCNRANALELFNVSCDYEPVTFDHKILIAKGKLSKNFVNKALSKNFQLLKLAEVCEMLLNHNKILKK